MKVEQWQLNQRQKLPLEAKEKLTKKRIKDWYEHWDGEVYVGFSGGKDSTVLLDQTRKLYPEIPAVFVDTGLEYPEIRNFIKTIDNVICLKPMMPFHKVIEKYGYPIISKENAQKIDEIRNTKSDKLRNKRMYGCSKGHGKLPKKWRYLIDSSFKVSGKCCDVMKKRPTKKYEKEIDKKPIIGLMASDSAGRNTSYLRNGCNSFSTNRPISNPMAFWMEQDIWDYINKYNINYSKIYDMGYDRTGCMFCMFGVHLEKEPNRFQKMMNTHPKHYDYCINKLGCGKVLDFINVPYK